MTDKQLRDQFYFMKRFCVLGLGGGPSRIIWLNHIGLMETWYFIIGHDD